MARSATTAGIARKTKGIKSSDLEILRQEINEETKGSPELTCRDGKRPSNFFAMVQTLTEYEAPMLGSEVLMSGMGLETKKCNEDRDKKPRVDLEKK